MSSRFPLKNKLLLDKWVHNMRRSNWTPSGLSRICSAHFEPDCYEQKGWASKKTLKGDAVPTIFDFPEHLQKKIKTRPSPKKRKLPLEHPSR